MVVIGRLHSYAWDSGPICVGLAAFIFALSGLFVKLLKGHVPEFEIVVCRSFLSFIACAIASYRNDVKPFFGHKQNVHLLLGRALSGSIAMAVYYFSIGLLALADAVTLFFLNPAITALVAWPVLKEPLGALGIAGVLSSLLGVILVSQPPAIFDRNGEAWSPRQTLGTTFGVTAAFLASVAFIFIRLVGKKESPITMSVYFHLTALITSGIPLACGFPSKAVLPGPIALLLLLGISASSFWGQLLIGRGLQLLNAAHAGAINITQVLYSYIFGVLILGEHLSWLSLIGSVFIASGVVCVSSKPKAQRLQEYARVSTAEETIAQGGPHIQPAQPSHAELEMGTDSRTPEVPIAGKGLQSGAETGGGTESSKDAKLGGQEVASNTSEAVKVGMWATKDGAAHLAILPPQQSGHHAQQNGHHHLPDDNNGHQMQGDGHHHPLHAKHANREACEQSGEREQLQHRIEEGVLMPPGHRAEQDSHLQSPHASINVEPPPVQPQQLPVSFGSANSSCAQLQPQPEGHGLNSISGDSWQGSCTHHQSISQVGSQGVEQQQGFGVQEHQEGGTYGLPSSNQWYGYLLGPVEGHEAGLLSLQQAQAEESLHDEGRAASEGTGHERSETT